ncbi:hypothetical protein HDU97_002932 [Phlyctochytrium planicorne]|nr:hypothetical protein HDU97_002932 [Phlyctochytrium planicorne]
MLGNDVLQGNWSTAFSLFTLAPSVTSSHAPNPARSKPKSANENSQENPIHAKTIHDAFLAMEIRDPIEFAVVRVVFGVGSAGNVLEGGKVIEESDIVDFFDSIPLIYNHLPPAFDQDELRRTLQEPSTSLPGLISMNPAAKDILSVFMAEPPSHELRIILEKQMRMVEERKDSFMSFHENMASFFAKVDGSVVAFKSVQADKL